MRKKLTDIIPPPGHSTVADRLAYCRATLFMWGMLTERESERIEKRLKDAYAKEKANTPDRSRP